MVNYQLGKIYRIVCNTTGKVYIGSTCEPALARRLSKHNDAYKQWKKGSRISTVSSFQILELNNYEIILIENYPCDTSDELHSRERFFVENTQCVNKNIPSRTNEEYHLKYYQEHKEEHKQYYEEHKEKILQNRKIYQENNKEKIKEYKKEWWKNKKETRSK